MLREPLSVSEIRNVEEGDYIVARLHEDCYWQQGEGSVQYVNEKDNGQVIIGMKHQSRLKVPADGRKQLTFTGAPEGARNLPVAEVYKR